MYLKIIQSRKINYTLSLILLVVSILSLIAWRLKPGLDFTGGSLLDVRFNNERPQSQEIQNALKDLNLGEIKIQPAGENNAIMRFKDVDEETHQKILQVLNDKFSKKIDAELTTTENEKIVSAIAIGEGVEENRFESVGPIIGEELKSKAWLAVVAASLMIVFYIAYAFRKVSKPVASWKYGTAAVIALIHDITIVTGVFSLLGHFRGIEVDGLFITALLTILGFSVHDTIVVFDRARENLSKHYSNDFEVVFNDSINQTISRSINTSLTTLLVLVTLFLFGGESIKYFSLALIAGVIIGTYSSIFVASPLVVDWHYFDQKRKGRR